MAARCVRSVTGQRAELEFEEGETMRRITLIVILQLFAVPVMAAGSVDFHAAARYFAAEYVSGDYAKSVCAGDFDGDGDCDIATANYYSVGGIQVFLNDGDGILHYSTNYGSGSSMTWICAAELDGDGDLDFAAVDFSNESVSILLGNGDGTFANAVNYTVGNLPEKLCAADLDGDGYCDDE